MYHAHTGTRSYQMLSQHVCFYFFFFAPRIQSAFLSPWVQFGKTALQLAEAEKHEVCVYLLQQVEVQLITGLGLMLTYTTTNTYEKLYACTRKLID